MAEIVYKSPGVFTREIDNSQPSPQVGPLSTPAGIIGTADLGPAFVPVTVNSLSELTSIFGDVDGSSFGRLAASEYLRNGGGSVAYVRVLGVGDGKQRNDNGTVTNAGFVVGNEVIQADGNVGNNIYANAGIGDTKGRTYFLGCFMSESNGSTIFSDAGIQQSNAIASLDAAINTDGKGLSPLGNDNTLVITVPVGAGGDGVTTIQFTTDSNDGDDVDAANVIGIGISGGPSDTDYQNAIIAAINGDFTNSRVTKATSGNGSVSGVGVKGITAAAGSGDTINITADNVGSGGNTITLAMSANSILAGNATSVSLAGGSGGAVPILRGVLLAPSGVALSLSGAFSDSNANNVVSQSPLLTTTATTDGTTPRYGQMTGSVEMAKSGSFTLLLNGFKGSTVRASNIITASFDPTSISYFGDILNTDPLKIEEHGHLLYSHYYIHPQYAIITGSEAVPNNVHAVYENIAFILTGSNTRGITSGFGNVPDYEDFQDRFSHSSSPFIISQDLGETYDLFKLVALSPGPDFASKYKFSIQNINPNVKTFDLLIRNADDVDGEVNIAEAYYGLSLDPDNDFYVARVIGDFNTRYNFENSEASQGLVVEGSHPNVSKLVRVVVSSDLENGNVPKTALPFGFRGPMHTVTSGSMLAGCPGNYAASDLLQRVKEPPFPFRETVSSGEGVNKQAESKYFWGFQKEAKINVSKPNLFDNTVIESHNVFTKHYPTHRTDTTSFAVKENVGTANVNGSILDVDLFNNNKFSLENVKVVTASNGRADTSKWLSASYVRGGGISADDAAKTRALSVNDLVESANQVYAKFTCLFQGGFNGVNIFDEDKANLANDALKREYDNVADQGGVKSGPTIKAYRKAMDVLGSKTDIDIQLLSAPGIRHSSVTDYGISVAENRFDSLFVFDIEKYNSQNNLMTGSSDVLPSIRYTVDAFINRGLDTSFGAAYFPDVNMQFQKTNGEVITKKVPPSVGVLGAYANNDSIGKAWFAPAGNTRGALSTATSSELGTLTRTNLDKLYEADINPINTTINYGVVIQGQKTLLKNLSALDRINVRRLLISIRRSVRNIANTLIFEPNRVETLSKFTSLVNPVLESLKNQQGVSRYKVVIDQTTTTQADVENNTIRGKIYIQPVRVAEFIALDFNLTNNGTID